MIYCGFQSFHLVYWTSPFCWTIGVCRERHLSSLDTNRCVIRILYWAEDEICHLGVFFFLLVLFYWKQLIEFMFFVIANVVIYFVISHDPCRAWPKCASIRRAQTIRRWIHLRWDSPLFFFLLLCWSNSVTQISFYLSGWWTLLSFRFIHN